jgi:hypothetical protein
LGSGTISDTDVTPRRQSIPLQDGPFAGHTLTHPITGLSLAWLLQPFDVTIEKDGRAVTHSYVCRPSEQAHGPLLRGFHVPEGS